MHHILLLLLLAVITGCTVKPTSPVCGTQTNLDLPQKWTVEGRIALKTPEDKLSASMKWYQCNDDYQLRLSKPIGGTLLYLTNSNGIVELQVDGKTYTERDAEKLLWQVTGWTLPVKDFRYWITGLLNPNSPPPIEVKRNDNASLKSFISVDNWRVSYQNYKVFSDKTMPHNLTIEKDKMYLRLRVSDWEFDNN